MEAALSVVAELRLGIGYVRVSKVMGRAGETFISPAVQRSQIEAYAAINGIRIVAWYEETDVTGRTTQRDEFQNVLAALKGGDVDVVVVATLDRFSRDTEDTLREERIIREAGGELLAADVPFVPGATGREMFLRRAVDGEVYSLRIGERWASARQAALDKGRSLSKVPNVGYVFGEGHRLVAHEVEGPAMRQVFLGRAAGRTWDELAAEFTATTGRAIHAGSLKGLVRNRVYVGELHVKGLTPNLRAHEGLVTEAEWQAAQSGPKPKTGPKPKDGGALLSGGLLVCAACGRPMSYRGDRTGQYTCQRKWAGGECRYDEATGTGPALISAALVDEYVDRYVADELDRRSLRLVGEPADGDYLGRLHAELEAIDRSHDRWEASIEGDDDYPVERARMKQRTYSERRTAKVEEIERAKETAGVAEELRGWTGADYLAEAKTDRRVLAAKLLRRVSVHRLAPGAPTHSPVEARVVVEEHPALAATAVEDRVAA